MTGICGWLGGVQDPGAAREILESMSEPLLNGSRELHSLMVSASSAGIATVHAPKAGGIHQDGDCVVCYEGYPRSALPNFSALTREKGLAHAICAAYRDRGPDLLRDLSGPFSLAIVEPLCGKALLAIDKLGIRPLAYTQANGTLVFASRLDAILPYPGIDRTLSPQSLFNYLYFHVIPSPDCIYAGMIKLRPGEYVSCENGILEKRIYWTPHYEEDVSTNETVLSKQLHERLRAAVQRCMDDRSIGVFLSGGLDSTSVTGVLTELSSKPVNAYAIGFDAKGYDEMPYARASATHFQARLHEHYVHPRDVADAIPLIASAYDEPFGNASAVPAYYCARAANRDGIQVLLAGDGGDELFAGNARYAKQKVFQLYSRIPRWLRIQIIERATQNGSASSWLPLWRKVQSYVNQAKIPMPDRMESYNFLNRTSLESVLHPAFLAAIDARKPITEIRETYGRADTETMLKRMLYLDLKFTLADNDLRKVNRMCEIAGVKVRYPMLDDDLVEFSTGIPSRILLRGVELRAFYRESLKDFLPKATLAKKKHGFGLPIGIWLVEHKPLRELTFDSLSNLKKRNYLNPAYIDELLRRHQYDHAAYYGVMMWVLLVLEQWLARHDE